MILFWLRKRNWETVKIKNKNIMNTFVYDSSNADPTPATTTTKSITISVFFDGTADAQEAAVKDIHYFCLR